MLFNKVITGLLLVFVVAGCATIAAELMSVTWTAPTTNMDGTPLTDLAGFHIYDMTCSGQWGMADPKDLTCNDGSISRQLLQTVQDPTATSYDLQVEPGEYHVAMTAFDDANNESGISNIVYHVEEDTVPPKQPTNVDVN